MKPIKLIFCLLALLTLFSCKKAEDFLDFKSPEISSHYPSHYQKSVPNNAIAKLEFSESMNKSSVQQSLSYSENGASFPFYFKWESSKRLLLMPLKKMTTGASYQIILNTSAKDENENNLSTTFILIFSVNADNSSPNNTDIFVQDYIEPANTPPYVTNKRPEIRFEFSESMDVEATTNAISHEGIQAVYHWENSNRTLRLEIIKDLEYGKKYVLIVGTAAKDTAGNMIREDRSKFFYMGNNFNTALVDNFLVQKVGEATPVTDLLAPVNQNKIINNISNLTMLRIRFNRDMDLLSLRKALSISPNINIKTMSLSSPNTLDVHIQENVKWEHGKQYYVNISREAKDTGGNPLLEDFKISFVIGSDLNIPKISTITVLDRNAVAQNIKDSPTIVNHIPLNPKLKITFDKAMDPTLVRDAISFSPTISSSYVITKASADKKTYDIEIQEALKYGTVYELSINSSAKDEARNLNLDKTYKSAFCIGDKSNFLKITSITYNGLASNANVSLKPLIVVNFDKKIDLQSCYEKIKFFPSINLSNSEITLHSPTSILIRPKNALKPGTDYQIKLLKDIHVPNSTDVLMPPLLQEYTYNFKTSSTLNFEIKDLVIRNSGTIVNAITNKVKISPVENVDTDGASGNESVKVEITFTNKFDSDTIINNISIKKAYDPTSSNKVPYISDYQNLSATNTHTKLILTIKNVEKGEIYYILEIKGKDMGIKSFEGIPLKESSVIISFKTKTI